MFNTSAVAGSGGARVRGSSHALQALNMRIKGAQLAAMAGPSHVPSCMVGGNSAMNAASLLMADLQQGHVNLSRQTIWCAPVTGNNSSMNSLQMCLAELCTLQSAAKSSHSTRQLMQRQMLTRQSCG